MLRHPRLLLAQLLLSLGLDGVEGSFARFWFLRICANSLVRSMQCTSLATLNITQHGSASFTDFLQNFSHLPGVGEAELDDVEQAVASEAAAYSQFRALRKQDSGAMP